MRKCVPIVLAAALATGASAQVITSYDILDAAESGFLAWSHTYDGTITRTGSGTANGFPFDRADYTDGGGTLNDGNNGNNVDDTQLFANNNQADPRITVFLDGTYFVDDITLFSFDSGNPIPGSILGLDVTINGVTESFITQERTKNDEFIALHGSGLDGLPASSITFSNFLHDGRNNFDELFAISEIRVRGTLTASPIVTSYDILDAAESGFGGWSHTYDGTITRTGSGSAHGSGFFRADYTDGGGTLNDGNNGTDLSDTQLFANNNRTDPRITVFLDGTYTIDNIWLFSFDDENSIPGRIRALDVTINGVTATFTTTEPTTNNEFIEIGGSALDGLATSSITFSNIVHDGGNDLPQMFCISEIVVRGQVDDGCPADLDDDGDADADDFFAYLDAFAEGNQEICDIDDDQDCDADDFFAYLDLFAQGC